MKNTIIPLDSYTTAKKSAGILALRGIKARVIKTGSGRRGCTFGISVSEPPEHVCRILSASGITCGGSMPVPPPPPPHHGGMRPPRPPRR